MHCAASLYQNKQMDQSDKKVKIQRNVFVGAYYLNSYESKPNLRVNLDSS